MSAPGAQTQRGGAGEWSEPKRGCADCVAAPTLAANSKLRMKATSTRGTGTRDCPVVGTARYLVGTAG